ncbi:MAG: serine hydrolase, partial [Bacteroidota bacterium]
KDAGFRNVTFKDLLEMRSGISFTEGYSNPFGSMAKFYYGLDLKKYTLALKIQDSAGAYYNYQSANTQLLAMALEKATGKSLSRYLEEKIWQPMGAEYPATWSVDSKSDQQIKAFCCINARAIDFAKFGQLFLDRGKTGEMSVIPTSWVSESLTIQTDSRDSEGIPYTYHWRVTEDGDFFAKGILGQYIYVCPEKRIVIVRFGKKSADISWARYFRNLTRDL